MTNQEFKLKRMGLLVKGMGLLVKGMFGLAAVVFAFSALIYTINPAQADSPATTAASGKIMMHQNSFVKSGSMYYHILVWDTENGKSKLYWYHAGSSSLQKVKYQLPTSPLY